jgi:hypothetical protein
MLMNSDNFNEIFKLGKRGVTHPLQARGYVVSNNAKRGVWALNDIGPK